MQIHSFNFSRPADDDLPEVITAEMLAPPPYADPNDDEAFDDSLRAKFHLAFTLRKLHFAVTDFDDCVRELLGIEATAAGLAMDGVGKWRVGDDVRGEHLRVGFATGITGKIAIDRMVKEFAAANRSMAFAVERIKRLFDPHRDLIGQDSASVRDTIDRFLAQNADIWHDLRRYGCSVVKLMGDNITALTGADMNASLRHGLGMRHSREMDGQRSLRNALIMLSMIANDLRRQHTEIMAAATSEWPPKGFHDFLVDHVDTTRRQCVESAEALVDIADFPAIEAAARDAAARSPLKDPGGE